MHVSLTRTSTTNGDLLNRTLIPSDSLWRGVKAAKIIGRVESRHFAVLPSYCYCYCYGVADLTTAATWFKGPLENYRLAPLSPRTLIHPDPVIGLLSTIAP